ncbi:MAG TPA: hypothetical protein VGC87_12675 [Pyrinomonadaceae bacterium]|jgi:hypothetical protein
MKHNRAASTIGKLFLAFSILFGIGIWTSTTAQAQWQDDRYERQSDREYRREQRRREREARRNQRRQSSDYYGNNGYGYGNNGYGNNGYGNNGYRDADGYGNYGGSFNLRQTALNAGFADGVKEGRKDREHRDSYNFTDEGNYRSGDRDYSSRMGDREAYRRYYREAFQHGYDDGYNGY